MSVSHHLREYDHRRAESYLQTWQGAIQITTAIAMLKNVFSPLKKAAKWGSDVRKQTLEKLPPIHENKHVFLMAKRNRYAPLSQIIADLTNASGTRVSTRTI